LTKKEIGPAARNQDNLFTTAEVAKRLKCDVATIRMFIKKRKFKRVVFVGKQFLIYESSVEEFLRKSDPMNPKMRID